MNSPFTDFAGEITAANNYSTQDEIEMESPFVDRLGESEEYQETYGGIDTEELYEDVMTPETEDSNFENEFPAIYPERPGISPFALQAKKQWSRKTNELRPKEWQGKVYGLVVHTSGGSLPGKAIAAKKYPTVGAVDYYSQSTGCNYINGWKGIMGGDLLQVANEYKMAWGVGMGDQNASIANKRFEKDLPSAVVDLWKKRWPGFNHALELLPKGRDANVCYIHVECLPVVYITKKGYATDPAHPPMRPGLRFSKEQHDTIAILAHDIAFRNGWPMDKTWWKTSRLLGHEDLTPINRNDCSLNKEACSKLSAAAFNKKECWDPGGLRAKPFFDWDYVYQQIENISKHGYEAVLTVPIKIAPELKGIYQSHSILFEEQSAVTVTPELYELNSYENPSTEYDTPISSTADPVTLNKRYGHDLGWERYYDDINELLLQASGQSNKTLFGQGFVSGVSSWKRKNGLWYDSNPGVIDEATWKKMKPQVSALLHRKAIVAWGDKAAMATRLSEIVYLNLDYASTLLYKMMTTAQKKAFTTEWENVKAALLEGRKQFILSGNIPPLGKAKVPFGFYDTIYNGIKGLGTFNRANRYLASERVDKVLLALYKQGKISFTQDEFDLFQRVANAETYGMIQLLNSYDRGIVSIGFLQFTIHVGKIQRWIKLNEAAFKRFGIELDTVNTYTISGGTYDGIKGVPQAKIDELRWNGWAERFYYAGLDPDVIVAGVQLVKTYFAEHLSGLKSRLANVALYNNFITNYYNNDPYIRGLFQASYNNNPARSTECVREAVSAFASPVSVADFIKKYKTVLQTHGWGNLVDNTAHGTDLSLTGTSHETEFDLFLNEQDNLVGYAEGYETVYEAVDTETDTEAMEENFVLPLPVVVAKKAVAAAKNWCDIRASVVYILGESELDWFEPYDPKFPGGRFIHEGEKLADGTFRQIDYLDEYWKAVQATTTPVPGYKVTTPHDNALKSAKNTEEWSAAFVSWVMKEAGITEADGFIFSRRHITYVVQALSNARKGSTQKPIHLKDVSTPVEPGDILCFNVKEGGATNYKLEDLAKTFLDASNDVKNLGTVTGSSHCDVVKEIITDGTKKFAVVVGGNKSDPPGGSEGVTVASRQIELTAANVVKSPTTIKNPGSLFGVIKLGVCQPPAATKETGMMDEGSLDQLMEAYQTEAAADNEDQYSMNDEQYDVQEYFRDETGEITKDWSMAVRNNRYYATSLGWDQYREQINDLLLPYSGVQSMSLDENTFAKAVAAFQQQQDFSGNEADGIIGPHTWNKMKPLLGTSNPQSVGTGLPTVSGSPSVSNITEFNRWHAQKILDTMDAGFAGSNFHAKDQLQQIVRGEQVLRVDPNRTIIQVLPLIYHITEQARQNNYRDIIIGSFIRPADSNGSCTGHCAGRCIDINYAGGNFESAGSVGMVTRILNFLVALPPQYKKRLGFGMPLQGQFFGHTGLGKYHSVEPSNIRDTGIRGLVQQLGIVFPDNDNHLHIQVGWM